MKERNNSGSNTHSAATETPMNKLSLCSGRHSKAKSFQILPGVCWALTPSTEEEVTAHADPLLTNCW